MTRIEQEPKQPTIVKRSDFDKDFAIGYVALEFNPEREVILTDRRSGRSVKQLLLADIMFRCVRCQFDSLDKKLVEEHTSGGEHPWGYGPFNNPYGHCADAEIEGIENYQTFLKEL